MSSCLCILFLYDIYFLFTFVKVVEKVEFNSVKLATHGHVQTFDDNCSTVGTRDK